MVVDGIEELNHGRVRVRASVVGKVMIGRSPIVFGRFLVREPTIIGENCKMGPRAHVDPLAAVGDRCHITVAEVDDSVVMDDATIDVEMNIVCRMIGKGSKALSANGLLPKGERLVVGENTTFHF